MFNLTNLKSELKSNSEFEVTVKWNQCTFCTLRLFSFKKVLCSQQNSLRQIPNNNLTFFCVWPATKESSILLNLPLLSVCPSVYRLVFLSIQFLYLYSVYHVIFNFYLLTFCVTFLSFSAYLIFFLSLSHSTHKTFVCMSNWPTIVSIFSRLEF